MADDAPPPEGEDITEALFASGELDLHTFHPRDVKELVPDFLAGCAARGHREVRIVHGKGTGALRRTVEALLARHPLVESFALADGSRGGWGATLVRLRAADV